MSLVRSSVRWRIQPESVERKAVEESRDIQEAQVEMECQVCRVHQVRTACLVTEARRDFLVSMASEVAMAC